MIAAFIVFCALWRMWLGGIPGNWPFEKGLTWTKYVTWLAAVGGFVWLQSHTWWLAAAFAVITLAMWRALPQNLDGYPMGPKPKDPILKLMGIPNGGGGFLAWWAYAIVRYGLFSGALAGTAVLAHLNPWPVSAIGVLIPLYYFALHFVLESLPYGIIDAFDRLSRPAPSRAEAHQHYHFCELLSGATTAAAIAWSLA